MHQLGTYAIANTSEGGTISGLALSSVPRVIPRVRKPMGGLSLFANVVAGTVTEDGFDFTISGQTDSANYFLDYLVLFT